MGLPRRIAGSIRAGVVAGVLPAFVELGWKQLLPPRTPDRDEPPLVLLQHLGVPADRLVFTFSGTEVDRGSLALHFGFSASGPSTGSRCGRSRTCCCSRCSA